MEEVKVVEVAEVLAKGLVVEVVRVGDVVPDLAGVGLPPTVQPDFQ